MVCGEENILVMSPCCSMTDFTWTQEGVLNGQISPKYSGEGTKGNTFFSSQFHLQGPCLGVIDCVRLDFFGGRRMGELCICLSRLLFLRMKGLIF